MATRKKHKERSRAGYSKDNQNRAGWFTNSGRWAGIASKRKQAMSSVQ